MSQPFYSNKMIKKSKASGTILYVSLLTFLVFALYILYINKEVLYTAQERSEFLIGTPFFSDLLSKPFGLMQYVGAWLAQYLFDPVVGGGILLAIWVLSFFFGVKAFRLQGSAMALMLLPIACLLTSIVDLGYWIYIFRIKGYWFSQSVGFLIMLILLWGARCTPRKWHLVWYVLAICTYPVLGWFALLLVICLAFTEKPSWRELLGMVLLLFTANIWKALLYSDQSLDSMMLAGLPIFETPTNKSEYLTYPFCVLGVVSILIALLSRYLNKWFVPVLCVIAGIVFTWSFMFQDKNYIEEMRMVRSAEADDWEEVLDLYGETSKPTTSMVFLKNVALMNEGGLLERSFKMKGNNGTPIYNPDSLRVSFLQVAAPVAYYNYGLMNDGFRLAFECAVQTGFSPFYLKMLTRCALANGEKALVDRYITLLHGHPYYEDWQPAPVTDKIHELQQSYPDEITGIENSDSYLVNSIYLWNEADSRVASEQALFYSMMRRDAPSFWKSLRKFIKMHQNEEFPMHAQEAYILYIDRFPEEKKMMVPVSQDIYERYKLFWEKLGNLMNSGMEQKNIPEKMNAEFGDTYWFYYVFGRKYINNRATVTSY